MRRNSCAWERYSWFPAKKLCIPCFLFVLLGLSVSTCHAVPNTGETENVQVEVRGVSFDRLSNSPVVILQNKEKTKAIPIWVGAFEAQAIYLEMQGKPSPRPMTHDLMKNILEKIGVEFEKVVVSELKGSTYYARIHLASDGKPLEIDSRPSDAIALALRFQRPIFVARGLFEAAIPTETQKTQAEPESAKVAGVTVQNLTAELAAYFQLQEASGVLVADSDGDTREDHLQRGDVIVAVEGEVVHDVAEFREKVSGEKTSPLMLRVRRNGQELGIRLTPTQE